MGTITRHATAPRWEIAATEGGITGPPVVLGQWPYVREGAAHRRLDATEREWLAQGWQRCRIETRGNDMRFFYRRGDRLRVITATDAGNPVIQLVAPPAWRVVGWGSDAGRGNGHG